MLGHILCISAERLLSEVDNEWVMGRGGQSTTWQESMKALISGLVQVWARRIPLRDDWRQQVIWLSGVFSFEVFFTLHSYSIN